MSWLCSFFITNLPGREYFVMCSSSFCPRCDRIPTDILIDSDVKEAKSNYEKCTK